MLVCAGNAEGTVLTGGQVISFFLCKSMVGLLFTATLIRCACLCGRAEGACYAVVLYIGGEREGGGSVRIVSFLHHDLVSPYYGYAHLCCMA
jgi:hypothetical protein